MMKKIVVLLLLVVSTNVMAEWTAVGSVDNLTVYVDFGTIKRKGNKVKMWHLFDFKTVKILPDSNTKYLSLVSRNEYDCEEETSVALDMYWYSENMRGGEVVYSSTTKDDAISILPGSINETFYKAACRKK